jgi:PD-(D/E)XK nuclease superfamily
MDTAVTWEEFARTLTAHTRYTNAAGEIIPGVSTVLASLGWQTDALIAWTRKTALLGLDPSRVRDTAAEGGRAAHYLIDCHIRGMVPDLDGISPHLLKFANAGYDNFCQWAENNRVEPCYSECQVVSETWQFGGTIDCIAFVDGRRDLVDFKTSTGIYPSHKIQVAAYRAAWNETHPYEQVQRAWILQIGRAHGQLTPHLLPEEEVEAGWRVFQLLRQIHGYREVL